MGGNGLWLSAAHPILTQDGRDGDEEAGYILNMTDGCTAGFKYFDFSGVHQLRVRTRGYCKGVLEIRTSWNGPVLGTVPVGHNTLWTETASDITLPGGMHALYFTYRGTGSAEFLDFTLDT